MKKKLLYLILPIVTLILEILPYGAVCNFMRPPSGVNPDAPVGHFRELYSYFDLTPFGYANFAPLLTAILTCAILVMLLIYLFTGKQGIASATKVMVGLGVLLSLCPLLFGISFFSVVGVLITVTLLAEFILMQFTMKKVPTETT